MGAKESAVCNDEEYFAETIDFDELESRLEAELDITMSDFSFLKREKEKINTPKSLSDTVAHAVWEQFLGQLHGNHVKAGEDFADTACKLYDTGTDYSRKYPDYQDDFPRNERTSLSFGSRHARYNQDDEVFETYLTGPETQVLEAGWQPQREEAYQIRDKAAQAAFSSLLKDLVGNIAARIALWIHSGQKNLDAFLEQVKDAVFEFAGNLKQNVISAGAVFAETVAEAIIGPVVRTVSKICKLLKQGAVSLKQAVDYIKNPQNKNKPVGILMLEAGKIIVAGLTTAGALVLGEVIEKALMAVPGFAFEIPLFGSIASILGSFFGALVAGIAGALAIHLIDKVLEKKRKRELTQLQIEKGNEALYIQGVLIAAKGEKYGRIKYAVQESITDRHQEMKKILNNTAGIFFQNESNDNDRRFYEMDCLLDDM